MLWRLLTQTGKTRNRAATTSAALPQPLGYALEARMMFDGAVAATVTQADATQNASEAAQPANAAKDDSQTHNNNQTDNGQGDHAVTQDNGTSDVAVAGEGSRKEVVFIDTSLTDYQTLVDNVPSGVEVILLDGSKDGLSQLTEWAKTHSGYDAIHVLSHGGEGELQLGSLTLDSKTADARAADLATLGAALTESGDLLLYGCEVAQDSGQSFVSLLGQITGADIAASTDNTGLGGNWELEVQTGAIEAATLQMDSYQHTLHVNDTEVTLWIDGLDYSTNPVGPGSEVFLDLRDAASSEWYIDIDPATSTITMTILNGQGPFVGLESFDLVFNNLTNGTLLAITSITKDNSATTSVAELSASVIGTDKTITFHIDKDGTKGDGVLVWHFTSTNLGGSSDTLPSVSGSGTNPTYTENGAAVGLFTGITADTNDSGQTFTGATFTVTNVADSTEYLNINGVKVSLINGNSVSLGSGYGSASVSLSAGTATISLSGATLSNADMGTLLSGMTYGNSSENPHTTARVVTLTQVTDSGASNNSYSPGNITSTVAVVAVNDAPTDITLSSSSFGQSIGSNGTVGTLTATDVDSTTFTYSLVSGVGSTDNARFTLVGNSLRAVDAAAMAAGTYSIRLQVSDGSDTYEKTFTLTVVDNVAPTFDIAPAVSNATSSGFDLSSSLNEAGSIYYVVLPDGATAPSATQIVNGQNAAGSLAFASGSTIVNSAPYSRTFTLTGLAAATAYDVYMVAKDSAGNLTASVVKLDATTTAPSQAPTLSASASNPVFISGMAGAIDLFSNVSANTNDSGQTFSGLTLTVSNVSDGGEFINIAGKNISLATNNSGSLDGIGNYSVTRAGNLVTVQLSAMSANASQVAGLVDGMRYGNSSSTVTTATRDVTLSSIRDSGSSNNTAALNIKASVNVQNSNGALYVTSGADTGVDAVFGSSLAEDMSDGGGLSLREALHWANVTAGIDRIVFQTDVTLNSSILSPTQTLLIDGQSFTLNGGGYSGFQIMASTMTFAIQNLTLTDFTTSDNMDSGGVLGISGFATDVNFRLYNVTMSGNTDNGWGNGLIDLYNLNVGTYIVDLDRVNIHDNILSGSGSVDGVIKLYVSGTQQTVSLSLTNSAIYNNKEPGGTVNQYGAAALHVIANSSNPTATNISLMNVTFTGQDAGIVFEFINNTTRWTASVHNSVIAGNTLDLVTYNNGSTGTYTLNGANNIIGGSVNLVSATDPRLAVNASNAINQGDRFYVTGDTDVRGMDRVRQNSVDIGAYESQFASGVSPQLDLNGAGSGTDYAATVSTPLNNGVAISDALASLIQTDGDTRIWTLNLSLAGAIDGSGENLTLSREALLAAHAAGINVSGNGSQTVTLTGGATTEAFQTALRAIVYVNAAVAPTGGVRTITVTANDDASRSATSTLTVVVNNPPVVATPIPAQSVVQDDSLSFTVPAGTFTDADVGDTLTLSATLSDGSPLPGWLSFDPATGTFSGTPANGDVGSLSIKVTATDGSNAAISTSFSLTVTNVNDAPVVATPIPAQSVAQDDSLSFTVPAGTFTDADVGDTLTLSATLSDGSPLPGWLSFDPATGTFSGTPANSHVGSLSIKVTATDGSNAAISTSFSLTVTNVNDAPVVSATIPAQSVAQDGSLNFTVPAGTFSDPDGDTLTLTATLANGSPLPSWLTFNPATRTFSGTPGNGDVGSLSIKVTANDGDASVSTSFSLTVTNVNDAPVVSATIPAQSVAQDSALSYTVPAGTFTDPDGDTLTFTATLANGTALPSWLTFNAATRTFSGIPANGDVGSLSIKVTANDGNASVSTTFSLTVTNVNDAPEVGTPIPPQTVAQDGGFNFTMPAGTFSDPDGDTLTLSATLADGSPLPSWLSFNPATGTFTGTPSGSDIGILSIKVTANDGDASVSTTFNLTVTDVNHAPVVATPIPAQSVAQDGSLSFTVPAGTFTDPDGDTLTLSATLANGSPLPSWLSFNPATRTFSGTPGNTDVGDLTIKITANDGDASVSTTFSLTVTNVNDAPVVSGTIPPQSVAQGGSLNFTVPAGTFSDPDGDTLTLSATRADGSPLPSWLTFNTTTGTFSGTPGNADVGNLTIKITANDGDASVSTTFSLTVTNINDAPVVSATIPAQNVAQGGGFNFTVPTGTFSDPDGDTLTLSATRADGSPLPSWLHFDPTIGTFSGTPGNGDVGMLVIRVTATDGSSTSVSTSFGLTVTNVNDAPVVSTPIPPQSVAQDGGFNFTVPAGTFTDPDGDTLTLSATRADGSPLPSWLHFDPTIGTFSGTPGNGDVGTLVIRVTATDGSNTSISTSFGLTVTNVNDAPVVSTPIPPQSVAQDGGFNFTVPAGTFTDPDGDTLTLSATRADGSPLPSWLRFDPTIGTFSGTPGNGDVGTLVIRVTATDDSNTSISTSFGLTVTNVNDTPVVSTPIPPQSVAQDGSLNFTIPNGTFSDPDGDALTLSATLANGSPLPSWLRFDPTIGTFSGTPGNGDIGTLVIRVTATDGSSTSISTSFGLTVTRSLVGGDPQFKANDGIGRTASSSDTRQLSTQDVTTAPSTVDNLIANPSLGSFTVGNDGAPRSVMSAIFATGRQNTEGGSLPVSQVAGTFGPGVASGIGVNFDSTLGSFPSFSKDPALGGTSSLASAFSGIYLPSLTPMEVFSGGSWKDVPFDGASSAMNSADDGTGRSMAFTPSLHQQLQQIGDSELQRLAAIEQALQESGQQQG
ncbi:putative Ig domain-containing protein [Pectobacterium wasabiae]|uniref:putative Ig domain-containing protein n=1 Tax=Pectobacterium wasabiae TaxID=55208 RepID=UPI00084F6FC6|nr:putative Ig domain-containing protein [Pectobacterium wasabiae]AOR63733.1 hypothetical protein A7983_10755 [Pectobacterium wasabiae CFBP 3304]